MERGQLTSKPSNIPWLGQVPDHWEVKRLKYLASTNDEALAESADPTQEIVYVEIGGVDAIEGIVAKEQLVLEDAPSRARRLVKEGDTIVSTVRTYLRAIAPIRDPESNMVVSTGFAVIRPRELYPDYLGYALRAPYFVESIVSRSTGVSYPGINASEIGNIEVAYPPLPEQRAIATYLDERTARIDGLVARQRRLVQLLKEKRQALITRAVTRGLDPKAKLKDSGVPWLGEVPVGWEVEKFFRIVSITEGQVNPEVEPYVDMLLIAPNHIESRTGKLIARETSAEQAAESGKYLCPDGAVVYSKIRPALRKATAAPEPCLCSADMYPMMGINGLTNGYLLWLLLCDSFSQWVVLDSDRVAMPKVNRDTLNAYWLPLPPVDEQEAIVKFIAEQTSRIDTLVTKVEQAVERLQEYRTALISAAVTGKVRVPAG